MVQAMQTIKAPQGFPNLGGRKEGCPDARLRPKPSMSAIYNEISTDVVFDLELNHPYDAAHCIIRMANVIRMRILLTQSSYHG